MLGLLKRVLDLLDALQSLVALTLVCLVGEHSRFHFVWVQNIRAEWVFDLATVGVDFVVCEELGWNEDLLAHFNFLLALVRVVAILVAENILEFLAHLVFELPGSHLIIRVVELVDIPVHQVGGHADIVVRVNLVGLMLLLDHFDRAILVFKHIIRIALGITIHKPGQLRLDWDIRQPVLKFVSGEEFIFAYLSLPGGIRK